MAKIIIGVAMIAAGLLIPGVGPFALALQAVAVAGFSMVLGGIAQKLQGQHSPGIGIAVRQAAAPWNVVYGRSRLGGIMIYASNSGFHNGFFRCVVAHTGHQIQGPLGLYLDGKLVEGTSTFSNPGGGNLGSVDETLYDWDGRAYNWKTFVYWEWRNGLVASPSAYGDLVAFEPNWTDASLCMQRATSYLRLTFDTSGVAFPNGIPGIRVDVAGKNDIYDPRSMTYGYTENWALIVADYLCNKQFGLGCNYATEIDEAQLIAAANICDEQIVLAPQIYDGWTASNPYPLGAYISPGNYYVYRCITSGTSGSSPPAFPTTKGATVTEGSTSPPLQWICEGAVNGRTEPRYAVNGTFTVDSTPGDVLNNLMTAAAGRVVCIGGVWKIFPGAWYGVGIAIGDDDLAGPIKWLPKRKYRDLVNAVKGTFICPTYPYCVSGPGSPLNTPSSNIFNGMWQATDFPVYARAGYLADDAGVSGTNERGLWTPGASYSAKDAVMCQQNAWVCLAAHTADATNQPGVGASTATYWQVVNTERQWQDLRLAFTISTAAAQRIAKIYLMRNRQQGTGTLVCKISAARAQAMDIITWTHRNFGFNGKQCEISNFRWNVSGEASKGSGGGHQEAPVITCELDTQETDLSVYSWSPAEEQVLYSPGANIPLGAQ